MLIALKWGKKQQQNFKKRRGKMFKKMIVSCFFIGVFWMIVGMGIFLMSFMIDIQDAQFWALVCLINFAPFFLGLGLIATIGAFFFFSEERRKLACRIRFSKNRKIESFLNGIIYLSFGGYLYIIGVGQVLNDIGRYIVWGEINFSPAFLLATVLSGAMMAIGLHLISFSIKREP